MHEKKSESSHEPELIITRVFNAPRELVFRVWTDPKHLVKWWGPQHFTSPVCKVDLREGGKFLFCMQDPGGKKYWNTGVFHEIISPEKIVSSIYFADENGNIVDASEYGLGNEFPSEMRDVVTFATVDGNKTKLTLHRNHPLSLAKKFQEDLGWNQSLDKFEVELEKEGQNGSDLAFVISRTFDAPRDLVYSLWTDPRHLEKWCKVSYKKSDVRPGGVSLYSMAGPNKALMWGTVTYREITKPDRLVYEQSFSDENGAITHHPMSPTWPRVMLTTILFDEIAGKTQITLTWIPLDATAEETATFLKGKPGISQGWGGSLDQLESYLSQLEGTKSV